MPTKTNIEPSLVARVAAGVRYAITGNAPNVWFGPMEPIQPVVQADQKESVIARQFDYISGQNLQQNPRAQEGITFKQLRDFAETYDLLRLVIETQKDKISTRKWHIVPRDKKKKPDATCQAIADFFVMPDKDHTWPEWCRMLLEDMFVGDCATVYPRLTKGGQLYALEPMDGTTIKRVIDASGRTPVEGVAYQQILKGVPAADYTRDELIYKPRNLRTHKLYGYSHVEQIVMTVNIALRRQLSQYEYYASGSTPNLIFSVPKEWSPDQIKHFEIRWNMILSGNAAEKAGTKFVPEGVTPINTKDMVLKDEYDEWLARIICYCFGVSPQGFIKQMNRATAETAAIQAKEEGILPVCEWVKNVHDHAIAKHFSPEYEFAWHDEDAVDPLTRAQIDEVYLAAKVVTADEVRQDIGKDPLTDEQKAELAPPAPVVAPVIQPDPNAKTVEPPAKEAGVTKAKKQWPATKPRVVKAADALQKFIKSFFDDQAVKIAIELSEASGLEKAEDAEVRSSDKAAKMIAKLSMQEWIDELPEEAGTYMASVAVAGGGEALAGLGVEETAISDLMREKSVAWAKERAAELVGMKRLEDGTLIPNPDAQWVITDSTRDMLRDLTTQALDEGWSVNEFTSNILENYAFSDARAGTIASTEMARADIQGNAEGWKASGLVSGMKFLANPDCCDECQEMDGEVAELGEGELPHPNCRCNWLAVLNGEED